MSVHDLKATVMTKENDSKEPSREHGFINCYDVYTGGYIGMISESFLRRCPKEYINIFSFTKGI
jgi:hypothetical protein